MEDGGADAPPRWLWRGVLGVTALTLIAALALIIALNLGWNNPRPIGLPDWEATSLPLNLEVSPDETATSLLGYSGADFTLETEAVPLSGPDFNGYGLAYRAQDSARYYAFAIGSDGYYAVLRVDAAEETMLVDWQQFPHIRRGQQANRLRVTCVGPICRFYVNDEYATVVEDGTWLTGQVGLWVRGFEESVVVQFTGVRLWIERQEEATE